MQPDLNDVALFVRVVREVSFSVAAKAQGVPVSTVSRRIARLEAALGARLLERTTRRLRLTDVGRAYFAYAERAVDELARGDGHVRSLELEPRGRVRITAPVGVGRRLTTVLAPYLAANPDVTIDIDLSERQIDLLAEGFDIAVRANPADSNDLAGRKLAETVRRLYASPAYLARRGRPRRFAELAAHDLIALRASASGAVWELHAGRRRHRLAFKPRLVVNELMALRHAARAGIGIALLPPSEGDALEVVLPRFTSAPVALWVLHPAHRTLTAAVRSCVDHLVATLS